MPDRNHAVVKGVFAGIIGGLAGAWAMNEFQSVSQTVSKAWKQSANQGDKSHQQGGDSQDSQEDDATMKTADRLAMIFTHQHLNKKQKKKAGPLVHFAYGALLGAVYGAISETAPMVTKGFGTAYGTAVWVGGDEIGVPAFGLSKPPTEYPLSVHANSLVSHVVYGASLDLVRRGVRALL
jgi:putative membrane protein